jgi:hypothetical protein
MSIRSLGMVHLNGHFRTYCGAHRATGAAFLRHLLALYESRRLVAFPVVFFTYPNVLIRADVQAKMAALTSFLIDNDFAFSSHRRVPHSVDILKVGKKS